MRSLNNEYSKQNEVVGGDIKEVVTMMGDIVGLMKSDKVKICEKKLKDVAKVCIRRCPLILASQ